MIALWDELNKSGKVGKKDEDKIYKVVNAIFKDHFNTDDDFPFDLKSTQFSVKLLWVDSQYEFSRPLARPLATFRWTYQNYITEHEYIEIFGKNGCIYTMGLFVDKDTKKPEIHMNDYTFNICTLKNKECAEAILKNGKYEKFDKKGNILYQIKNKQDCNLLCKNMVNMRDDDRNKYTPISHTRVKNASGTLMEGVLNIDHLKILQYLIDNARTVCSLILIGFESQHTQEEVDTEIIKKYGLKSTEYTVEPGYIKLIFQTIEDKNEAHDKLNSLNVPVLSAKKLEAYHDGIPPILKTSLDQGSYSVLGHLKFKSETVKKGLSKWGLGIFCSKENEFNCRTFAEDFYSDSSKLLSTLKSILPEPEISPVIAKYVKDMTPFTETHKSPKRKSKSLSPSQKLPKSKSKSLTPSQKSSKSKSLTPKRKSKSLTPMASQKSSKKKQPI